MAADSFHLLVRIAGKAVEGQQDSLPEGTQVAHMLVQIAEALFQSLQVRFLDAFEVHAAVHLQPLGRSHDNGQLGLQAALAALDVVELLRTQVGTEAGFRHHVVAEGHSHLRGQDGVASVGDVGKGTAVYEGRRTFCGLHQVGVDGILQQDGDGTGHPQVLHREGCAVEAETEDDVLDAAAQVILVLRQAEDGHDFRSGRDVEARLLCHAVGARPQAGDNAAQGAVVHVEHTPPNDFLQSEATGPMLVKIIVEQGRYHVVGRGDGVKVARKVQVDLLHGQHLCISAACRPALHAEART